MVATKFAYLVAMFGIAAMSAICEASTMNRQLRSQDDASSPWRVLESQIHFFSTTSELSPEPTSQPPATL